jgi:putative transposase
MAWGGARAGAGRPFGGNQSHVARPELVTGLPVLVAMHFASPPDRRLVLEAARMGAEGDGFRLIELALEDRIAHLLVEAADKRALSRGMQGLTIRMARALNRGAGEKGTVFPEHYRARQLESTGEVAVVRRAHRFQPVLQPRSSLLR